jgi:hypothetical protein
MKRSLHASLLGGDKMGSYKSLYLSDAEKIFVNKYLNNFNDWIKDHLHEEMENTTEYCQKKIEFYSNKTNEWEKKMKDAKVFQVKKDKARERLITEYNRRINSELKRGFLDGKTAERLLVNAGMSKDSFVSYMKKESNGQTKLEEE